MLLATAAILHEYGRTLVAQIQDNILNTPETGNYLPMRERTKAASEVHYEVTEHGLFIYGGEWVMTYEYGRGPTVNDGDGAVRRNVRAYIAEQGIEPRGLLKDGSPMDKDTLAYFISKRIHQEGSLPFRTGTQTGVLSQVINEQTVDRISSELILEISKEFSSRLLKAVA